MKSILLVGATSFLGSHIAPILRSAGHHLIPTHRTGTELKTNWGMEPIILDLTRPILSQIEHMLDECEISHAIVCAAISDVEQSFSQRELSEQVNVRRMSELFEVLTERKIKPIFFSSDYVFSGDQDLYTEEDVPVPRTVYGQQKLMAEDFLRENVDDHLIFRTSKMMSMTLHPRSILVPISSALVREEIVRPFSDQWITPVFVEDVARVVDLAIRKNLNGTYHLAMNRRWSREQIARLLAKAFEVGEEKIQPISIGTLKVSEKRPHFNTIQSLKIQQELNFRFSELEEKLEDLRLLFS